MKTLEEIEKEILDIQQLQRELNQKQSDAYTHLQRLIGMKILLEDQGKETEKDDTPKLKAVNK